MEIVPFQQNQDPNRNLGEGVSRTSSERSKLYELKIWLPGQGAMRDLVRAESVNQAIQFARNRYPNCVVEMPSAPAPKPRLARSNVGPREAERRRLRLVEKKRDNP
jgi:hypothetical protein